MNRTWMRTIVASLAIAAPATDAWAANCDGAHFHEFDFWLGDWQVHTQDGKLAGENRIERGYDGCVIHERYSAVSGYRGESLNIFDASRRVWHQTWVDSSGTLLLLEGGLVNGKMVLEGQTMKDAQTVTKHRISWSKNDDGSVRQHWESTDESGEWKTTFDGRYTRN